MAKKGGKRIGAGRPKGAITRIKVLDYFNEKELTEFWASMKERAKTDSKIALYFAEQMTGKAMQSVEANVSGELNVNFDNAFTSDTEDNS